MDWTQVKTLIHRALRSVGLEVQWLRNANTERQVIKELLKATAVAAVLDVGANVGQFGETILEAGFKGVLVSFEAIPAVHEILKKRAATMAAAWMVAPCAALGSRPGQIEINVSANTVSSSVLAMRPAHLDAAPQARYVDKQIVAMARLDELALRYLPPVGDVLLKIDVQGYEMEVLKGATALLNRIVAVQLELSLVPLYDGAPTVLDMMLFMKSLGYELYNVVSGFKDQRTGRLLQMDGFFIRAHP